MSLREYKLAVIAEYWRLYDAGTLVDHLRKMDSDVAIDAVLWALGVDPKKLRNPLPNVTLPEELDGLA